MKISLVVARINGLDGVALQVVEYANVLASLGYEVQIITGEDEKGVYGNPSYPKGVSVVLNEELSLKSPDRLFLYKGQFMDGETGWVDVIGKSSEAIFESLNSLVSDSSVVLVFNFLALRHYHPGAAVGLKKLVEKNQDKTFISHAADPDSERPEVVSKLSEFARKWLSNNELSYSGGPLDRENLHHIVLNPEQEKCFRRYGITKIFNIPDFVNLPTGGYCESRRLIEMFNRNLVSGSGDITEEDTFFLAPVRPVRRKRIKEAMDLMSNSKPKGVMVVTHPSSDDPDYAMEVRKYAIERNIRYVYLGSKCTHEMLHEIYSVMSSLKTVSIVGSKAGGFENAILESISYNIPVVVSKRLNSFPVLSELGFRIGNFDEDDVFNYIDGSLDFERHEIVNVNKKRLSEFFSRDAAKKRVSKMLETVS
mgnify:CR=1 FL=1